MTSKITYLIECQDRNGNIHYRGGIADNMYLQIRDHLERKVRSTKGFTILRIAYSNDITDARSKKLRGLARRSAIQGAFEFGEGKIAYIEDGELKHSHWRPFWQRCEKCQGHGVVDQVYGNITLNAIIKCDACDGKGGVYYPEEAIF
jgi:hypothetical protein